MRVLFVDDDSSVLKQAEIFLEEEDKRLEIDNALSAEEGLQKLSVNDYDAIVSDYQMPEMNGLDFLETVREDRGRDIPFIIFTGKGREDVAMDALNLGADRYLQKGGSPKSQYGVLAQAIVQEVKHYQAELELEEREEKYRTVMKNINDLVSVISEDGEILFANDSHKEVLGYDSEDLLGENVFEFFHPEDKERVTEIFQQEMVGGSVKGRVSVRFRCKDGTYKWIESSGAYLPGEGVFIVSRDISERKEARASLKESEKEFEHLLDSMIDAFALFESVFDEDGNFVSYRFLYINEAYEKITGVTLEEVKGKTVHEVWPETEPEWVKRYGEVAVTGESQSFDLFHDPTEKLYHCNVYRPYDTPEKFCVVFEDITERREREKELEESRKRFERAIDEAPFPIMLHAEDGEVIKINETWTEITGYSPEEVPTISEWVEKAYGEKNGEVLNVIKSLYDERGKTSEGEFEISTKSGEKRIWDFKSANLGKLPDGRSLVMSVATDITERKRKEKVLSGLFELGPDPFYILDEGGKVRES